MPADHTSQPRVSTSRSLSKSQTRSMTEEEGPNSANSSISQNSNEDHPFYEATAQTLEVDMDDSVDISQAMRQKIWLIKVPTFLAEKWKSVQNADVELGTLRVTGEKKATDLYHPMELTLSESVDEFKDIPKNYNFKLTKRDIKNTFVFTERDKTPEERVGSAVADKILGSIVTEANVQPASVSNQEYSAIMKHRVKKAETKTRTVKEITEEEEKKIHMYQSFSSKTIGRSRIQMQKKEPKQLDRKERAPRDELLEKLFKCFTQYEYWNLKGLIEETQQPQAWLKEVLGEIAVSVKRGPYVGKWTLKPELKSKSETGMSGGASSSEGASSLNNESKPEPMQMG